MSSNMQFLSFTGPINLRTDDTLTGSYVASTEVPMSTYDSLIVHIVVGTAQAGKVCNVKIQSTLDGTNWADECVDTAAASSAGTPGTQPYDPYIRVINVPMDTAGYRYPMRIRRMGSSMRLAVKSDGVTTGTISIQAGKASNYN